MQPMGGTQSRIALAAVAATLAFAGLAGTANAGAVIQSDPTAYTFLPGPYEQDLGESAIFDNSAASSYHDVTANRKGPDGRPLFFASIIPGGKTATVKGTEYLTAGTYPFFCTLHGQGMNGALTIDGSKGTIVARPAVKVAVVAASLKQTRKSGVKVKVNGITASRGVAVKASLGKTTLGSIRGLNLKAGQSRTLNLPLTGGGRKALQKVESARIALKATVPFGKPAAASRRIR